MYNDQFSEKIMFIYIYIYIYELKDYRFSTISHLSWFTSSTAPRVVDFF